jgi:hypothetical protein
MAGEPDSIPAPREVREVGAQFPDSLRVFDIQAVNGMSVCPHSRGARRVGDGW